MELGGSRFLVAGATGFLGERIAGALAGMGVELAVAGRDREALSGSASRLGAPAILLDFSEPGSGRDAVDSAVSELGGLDGVFIATGAVAFGQAGEIEPEVESQLMMINATGPMELISAALEEISPGGAVAAITAVVAEHPTAGMAAYSASKAALASYLTALRRERRKELSSVLEVSPGHMETGFAERALAGEPPPLPEGADPDRLIETALTALAEDRREVRYDLKSRELQVK